MRHGELVPIDSRGLTTTELLGRCLEVMNAGNRITFLVDPGMGPTILQRIRMRLSRLRNAMDQKNLRKQHFRLSARIYPYTDREGFRHDCLVLEKIRNREHQLAEAIEGMIKNGVNVGIDGAKSQGGSGNGIRDGQ